MRNISSHPLDKTETHVPSYGLKHSVTPKRIPTETTVSSVEAVLSRQRDLPESAKDNIRSRIASTVQSASIPDNNLTKDEQQALKRLTNDNNIVTLPADKGRVTVVMDKTDYFDKMDPLLTTIGKATTNKLTEMVDSKNSSFCIRVKNIICTKSGHACRSTSAKFGHLFAFRKVFLPSS